MKIVIVKVLYMENIKRKCAKHKGVGFVVHQLPKVTIEIFRFVDKAK